MKLVKKANGKQVVQMTKKEWLKIGQQLGMGLGGAGLGGMGVDDGNGSGALDDVTNSPSPSTDSLGTDSTDVNADPAASGEDPMQKIRRLVGELQSALDEVDGGDSSLDSADSTDTSLGDDSGLDTVDTGLESNPADQVI